jgi:hypothetical protein
MAWLTDAEIETEERKWLRKMKMAYGERRKGPENQRLSRGMKRINENSKQKKIPLRFSTMDEKKD